MAVVAAAAVPAGAGAHLFLARQAPQLKRLVNVLLDRLLEVMELFLGIQKATRDGILHQGIAMLFELGNFFPGECEGHLLLLLQSLSLLHEIVVMSPCFFVTHERVDALADRLHGGLIENSLAELTGLLHYGRFFQGRLHNQ